MASKYEQAKILYESYKNHPADGLRSYEKRLQKDPGNLIYQLLCAWFLQDLGQNDEVLKRLQGIAIRPHANLEPEIVSGIQETIAASRRAGKPQDSPFGGKELLKLWNDAIDRASANQKRRYRYEMFKAAIRDGYWDLAQQVFTWLQKEHPSLSYYHFTWIALSQIQADRCVEEDPKTAQMLRTLAFQSLKRVVTNTVEKKESPRKITSGNELRLVVDIYQKQAHFDELLSILDNPTIGINSDIAKRDNHFIQVKLKLLEQREDWRSIYDFCFSSLEALQNAKEGSTEATPLELIWADDRMIWTLLAKAASKTGKHCDKISFSKLTDRYIKNDGFRRNPSCVALLYGSCFEDVKPLTRCITFFKLQGAMSSCFDDLRGYLERLSQQDQEEFIKAANEFILETQPSTSKRFEEWIRREINLLKITYLLCLSKSSDPDAGKAMDFVKNCLRLFEFCRKESIRTGDEAATLAAMALLRIASIVPEGDESSSRSYRVQAACILEYLCETGEFDYGLLLVLLRVYILLGLGTLAMTIHDRLNQKEVQNDTGKHLFLTRISTIHPFPSTDKTRERLPEPIKDPLIGLKEINSWYTWAAKQQTDFVAKDLEAVPFFALYEFTSTRGQLERSFTRVMFQVEQRRMARLRGQTGHLGPPLPHFKKAIYDNRDFQTLPDLEHSLQPSFEEITSTGPKPFVVWLSLWTFVDASQTLLFSKAPPPQSQVDMMQDASTYFFEHLPASDSTGDLTLTELSMAVAWQNFYMAVNSMLAGKNLPTTNKDCEPNFKELLQVAKAVQQSCNAMRQALPAQDVPTWEQLHKWFSELELLKACNGLCDHTLQLLKQKNSVISKRVRAETVRNLKTTVGNAADDIQNVAREWTVQLQNDGKKRILRMMKHELNLEELLSGETLDEYACRMRDSAIDGLDGVTRVKVGS